jgi:UDP-2,3-diacylglucosamine hydrolase
MIKAFISDLHLEAKRPEIADLFIQFLKKFTAKENSLYILGDFFEAWIGDDDLTPFNQMIIDALHTATQNGLAIYFMHGNRDFLIGKKFLRMTGCQLLPDEYLVDIFGVPTLLMHGDTLCTEDFKYLKFRKKSRGWLFRFIILLHSLKKRRQIAERYRAASKAHTSMSPNHIMDVTQAEVERVMQKHHVQHMIHGHTHRPNVHDFKLAGKEATRTVLAAWHEDGSVLFFRDDGSKETVVLSHS